MSTTPPGWYQDPYGRAQVRWWSGADWTSHVSTNGQQFEDAPGGGAVTGAPSVAATVAMPAAAPPTAAARTGLSGQQMLLAVGAGALIIGAVLGYVLRGDGGDGGGSGGGGGASGGAAVSMAAPVLGSLTSLNTFEWQLTANSTGPGPQDRQEMSGSGQVDVVNAASYQKMVQTEVEDGETDTFTTESWRVGDTDCTFDPDYGEWETETRSPFELDLDGVLPGVFDLVVVADGAQLVGTEQVAGVAARHYTFTVAGLGTGSGAQVTANEGNMWVAEDGGYLVKYQIRVGLRTAPADAAAAEEFLLDLSLELTSINQPLVISLPATCPAAAPPG
jgi:hypothetical protein